MSKIELKLKALFWNNHDWYSLPNDFPIKRCGIAKNNQLTNGDDLANDMIVSDRLRQWVQSGHLGIIRPSDSFSLNFQNAFSLKQPVCISLIVNIYSPDKIIKSLILMTSHARINEFHWRGIDGGNFERFTVVFNSKKAKIDYTTNYEALIQDVKKQADDAMSAALSIPMNINF